MTARIDVIKRQLAEARQYLNNVLDQVGDRWDAQVYAEGAAWTVRQLLVHLMITDKGHNNMMMAIARGENTIPDDFDLERFNRRSVEKRAEVTPEEARAALAQTAAERDAWLDTIDDDTLLKQGRHGSMRVLSIEQILGVVADHDRNHANDIARVLGIPTP
ncbi:MAG: DinB family protein [Chloroflexi bacterium]|nr:DinB family protein [Chloroflexota bacterium]